MKRTIASLALLKANWDQSRKDFIENFVPFVATILKDKEYTEIKLEKIMDDFKTEFGLMIPYHPMITILGRAKRKGLIKKHFGKYLPVKERIENFEFKQKANEQHRYINLILNDFIRYCDEQFKEKIDVDKAEIILISFLKDHDLDILFAGRGNSILPDVKRSKSEKYLLSNYIKDIYKSKYDYFKIILDIAMGHILASAILYNKSSCFQGKLRNLKIYLDTRCIFRLLGTEGETRKIAYCELFRSLREQGAELFLFDHTYDEIQSILSSSLRWIDNPLADPQRGSEAFLYFQEMGYSSSDVQRFIVNVDSILNGNSISVVTKPDPNVNNEYQIDEKKLYDIIVQVYSDANKSFNEQGKEYTIQRDASSISSIYKLRKGIRANNLAKAGHIFLTSNAALAYANKLFDNMEKEEDFCIPPTITDIFLGTVIWLQSPARATRLNEKKIIADCFAALKPDDKLFRRFLFEVDKIKSEGKISSEEYYLLRSFSHTWELLMAKTMGDAGRFDERLPFEILEEIKEEIKQPDKLKYMEEKEIKERLEAELESEKRNNDILVENINNKATKIARWISLIIYIILLTLVVISILNFRNQSILIRMASYVVAIISAISLITGITINQIKKFVNMKIRNRIIRIIMPKQS